VAADVAGAARYQNCHFVALQENYKRPQGTYGN
jgi:hypothetical protein